MLIQLLVFSMAFGLGYAEWTLPLVLITSSSTPEITLSQVLSGIPDLISAIENESTNKQTVWVFWEQVDLTDPNRGFVFPQSVYQEQAKFFLDVTCDPAYSRYLAYQAYLTNVLQIVLERTAEEGEANSPNTVFMEPSPEEQADIFAHLISLYGWKNLGLYYNKEPGNLRSAHRFKALVSNTQAHILDEIIVDQEDTDPSIYIRSRLRMTSKSRAKICVVFSDSVTAAHILLAAGENSIGGAGFAWFFSNEAMRDFELIAKYSHTDSGGVSYEIMRTGIIGLISKEDNYDLEQPLHNYISALKLITQAYQVLSQVTGTTLRSYFLSNPGIPSAPFPINFAKDGIRYLQFDVYNMINSVFYPIGYWESSQNLLIRNTRNITWPGNSAQVPNDQIDIMKLVILYPQTDDDGNPLAEGRAIFQGTQLAVDEINAGVDITHNDEMKAIYLNTADVPYDNIHEISGTNVLGFVGPLTSDQVPAYLTAIATLPGQKPLVSYGASSANLSSSNDTPMFLRTIQEDRDESVALALFIQSLDWKRVGVIYTTDDYGKGLYDGFLYNSRHLAITIANSKNTVSPDTNQVLSTQSLLDIAAALDDIIANQIRIIVYLGSWPVGAELVLQAKNRELTGTNYAWLGALWLSTDILNTLQGRYSPTQYADLLSALEGCIALSQLGVEGSIGQAFQKSYEDRYNESPTIYSILAHDTVLLYLHGVRHLVAQSMDIYDGKPLLEAMSTAQFQAASGTVQISPGTNNRSPYGFRVLNMQTGTLVQVAIYEPLSQDLFNKTASVALKWAGNSPPTDSFPPYNCPFPQHMVNPNPTGVGIVIAIGCCVFVITFSASLYSYKKWKLVDIPPIKLLAKKTWWDTVLELSIFIEFSQLLALAPRLEVQAPKQVLGALTSLVMLDAMNLLNLPQPLYWAQLISICCLCYLWCLLVIVIMIQEEKWVKKIPGCARAVTLVSEVYLPLIGNTLFFSLSSQLLNVFVCDHEALGQSFVAMDCYMTCWTSQHIVYVLVSALAILFFEPVAVYSQPLWQQADVQVNLMLKPFFLLFRTCIQILLIAIGKSLQGISVIAHGSVFLVVMIAYCAVTIRVLPFNYNRCNLWEISSLIAMVFYTLITTLSQLLDPTNVGWFIALAVVWLLIVTVAVYIQVRYMPTLFRLPPALTGRKTLQEAVEARHTRKKAETSAIDSFEMAVVAPVTVSPAERRHGSLSGESYVFRRVGTL